MAASQEWEPQDHIGPVLLRFTEACFSFSLMQHLLPKGLSHEAELVFVRSNYRGPAVTDRNVRQTA